MAIWLYEDGIGEERALLNDQGRIVEARIGRHGGVKAGMVARAKLVKQLAAGKRGIGQLDDGADLLISPLPKAVSEGAAMMVEIRRAAIAEKGRFKLPLARPVEDRQAQAAPTVLELISGQGIEVRRCHAYEADHFAEAGWYDVIEEAQSGVIGFDGGTLFVAITPAMTLIDVDGELPPLALAMAGAEAAAKAVRRLDLQGSIGIDFPGLPSKADRQMVAEALDAAMTGDFERTAVNGFGLLQLVKRRTGPSLPEIMQHARTKGHALDLLRRAERSNGSGDLRLVCHPALIRSFEKNSGWTDELARRMGRPIRLHSDSKLAIGGGYAE
ncbi:MAG: ribonuclease [Sphingomonadales bacterium]|nr:ribonuclease [Sphingomonadales bacterium]